MERTLTLPQRQQQQRSLVQVATTLQTHRHPPHHTPQPTAPSRLVPSLDCLRRVCLCWTLVGSSARHAVCLIATQVIATQARGVDMRGMYACTRPLRSQTFGMHARVRACFGQRGVGCSGAGLW